MVAVWTVQRKGYLLYVYILALLWCVTAALQLRHGSTAASVSETTATYPLTQSHFTFLGEDNVDHWKRNNDFCWPLIDPSVATQIFCQCSDYKIRPIMTQAPTPGLGYEPCAAYSATATTDSSIATPSSTKSTSKTSSTSGRSTSTSTSSKVTTPSTSSKGKKSSTSVRTSTTTVDSKLVPSSTKSKRRPSSTSSLGSSKSSSHASTSTPTSKTSSALKSSSSSKVSSSSSTKTLTTMTHPVLTSSSSTSTLKLDTTRSTQSSSRLRSSSSSIKSVGSTSNSPSSSSLATNFNSTGRSSTLSFSPGVALAGNPQLLSISSSSATNTSISTPSLSSDQPSSPISKLPMTISASSLQAPKSSRKLDEGCPPPISTLPVPSDPTTVLNRRDLGTNCHHQIDNGNQNISATINTTSHPATLPLSTHMPEINGTYTQTDANADLQTQCQDFDLHQRQACWEVLNVTGFIDDWYAHNEQTCQANSMGFADCFLNLEVGAGVNCSEFTGLSQCPLPDAKTYKGRKNAAQVYYVAFNIWNIQNWFHTYWQALTGANGLTADNIASVCRLINVPQPKGFPLNEVLSVLAFALGLISPSGWGGKLPALGSGLRNVFTKTQVPGEYLLRAVQGSPTLSRNLLATGELGKTEVQIGAISSNLAAIVSQLESNVQNAIVDAMSNLSLFMEFASDGYFSTQIQNINTIQQNLTQALNTYVVSQAFQDDNVIITRALDTDVHALATNGTEVGYDLGCSQGYDEWGMCNVWWYDSENNISYGLESWKDMTLNFTKVLHDLFNTNVTTPQMLFQGSQVCANAAGGTQGDAPGSNLTTKTGIWNAECIANLKICTWELGVLSQEKEYTDCPGEAQFTLQGCGDQTDNEALLPVSYLGKWLFGGYEGIVCNTLKPGTQQPE